MPSAPEIYRDHTHLHTYGSILATRGIRGAFALNTVNPVSMAHSPAANTAVFIPVRFKWPYSISRFLWANGSVITSSSTDVGIYTPDGTRLASTGSTTATPASSVQYAAPSGGTYRIPAGEYYMAYVNNGTTNRAWGSTAITTTIGRMIGLMQMASALPLPATATFATFTGTGMPLCGVTWTTTGF